MLKIDERILEELKRYNQINNYIFEQDTAALPDAEVDAPLDIAAPTDATQSAPIDTTQPTPPADVVQPTPIDVESDPEVEKVDNQGNPEGSEATSEDGTEELEITDLVNSQNSIIEKQDNYFNQLFNQLSNLETKLGEMDGIMTKLNDLESKVEKYREKTPQERLELRTLDSGPFNQKLSQFFDDKEEDMEKTGKNEYILTQDEVEDYSPNEIKKTFRNFEDEVNPFRQVR